MHDDVHLYLLAMPNDTIKSMLEVQRHLFLIAGRCGAVLLSQLMSKGNKSILSAHENLIFHPANLFNSPMYATDVAKRLACPDTCPLPQ